ncbi:MAG: helix-turn-helix transcriptional regulator [Clostridiales bacterium]|nr:helix-turn-helix transcriptional regulator [Clostridiales bacterium]
MSISFQVSYLERMMPNLSHLAVDRHASGATEEDVARMQALCEQLRAHVDLERESESRYFETNKILYSILDLMYSAFCTGEQHRTRGDNSPHKRLFEVVNYLEDHYRENLTTQNVADHFGYSREYFCRLFKRYANQTFKQYLTEVRLAAAVKDLRMTDRGVGQIGIECGFPDEKSFFAAFRKKCGVTPTQYRAEM